jgi:hypothetical protein
VVDLCEVELNQMQPSEYPLAAEAKPDPGYVPTLMTPRRCCRSCRSQKPPRLLDKE